MQDIPATRRKSRLRFNILSDSSDSNPSARDHGKRCANCKQAHYLVENQGDNKNLFCTHCGALTPIRSIKHFRGLAAPMIQQPNPVGILQPENVAATGKDRRRPKGIHRPTNPLVQELENKGFQVIDVQSDEPVAEW